MGAVAASLRVTAPPPAPSEEVLVAARDLPAGTVLADDDLAVAPLPPEAAPGGALTDRADATGATLAAPVRAGEPITDVRLVGPGLVDPDAGTVAMPVRISDATQADLLRVGDAIDLLATDPEARTTTTVTRDAVVLAVPGTRGDAVDATPGRLVVLAVPAALVPSVATAGATSFVTFAWTTR